MPAPSRSPRTSRSSHRAPPRPLRLNSKAPGAARAARPGRDGSVPPPRDWAGTARFPRPRGRDGSVPPPLGLGRFGSPRPRGWAGSVPPAPRPVSAPVSSPSEQNRKRCPIAIAQGAPSRFIYHAPSVSVQGCRDGGRDVPELGAGARTRAGNTPGRSRVSPSHAARRNTPSSQKARTALRALPN